MAHVVTRIGRPDPALVQGFAGIGSATIHEAAGRIGSVDPAIRSLAKGVRLLGPAFTVSCQPCDNLMLHKALQIAAPGDILVVSTQGCPNAGYWGGLMTTAAMARGLGGLAIDGGVRDSEELIESGFPIFSRGICIRGTSKDTLGSINHPIVFGEVCVNPGDLIAGDDDGLVVIPRKDVDAVLAASRRRAENER